MQTVTVIVLDGLVYASWLFLVASGLTLIYGVMRILNMAHGSIYALGAYAAASAVTWYFSSGRGGYGVYLLLLAVAFAVGAAVGPLLERGVLRWTYGQDGTVQLMVTYALFLILEDLMKLVWGVQALYAYEPYELLPAVSLAGVPYPGYYFLLMGLAGGCGVLLWWFIHRTRFGKLTVAVIEEPEVSAAMGIRTGRVQLVAFIAGSILAAVAGVFTAPLLSIQPGLAVSVIVLAFAVVVTGGLGSLEGAAAGAVVVGLVRSAAVHLIPELELFAVYVVMALILLFRPKGLFGRLEVRRV